MTAARDWVAHLLHHIADGLHDLADHLHHDSDDEPATAAWVAVIIGDHIHHIPTHDAITHDHDDNCPCGPTARCQQTSAGDIWHITHHRLTDLEETQ